jgi:hypothetical protein
MERDHPRRAAPQEDARRHRPRLDHRPQHETADHEEHVDARRADGEAIVRALKRVEQHHRQGGHGAQILDAKNGFQAAR